MSSNHIKSLIANHTRRLQKLKEQQALYGMESSPAILIEIEDTEAKIEKLKAELNVGDTGNPVITQWRKNNQSWKWIGLVILSIVIVSVAIFLISRWSLVTLISPTPTFTPSSTPKPTPTATPTITPTVTPMPTNTPDLIATETTIAQNIFTAQTAEAIKSATPEATATELPVILFQDDFSSNKNNWWVGEFSGERATETNQIIDGSMRKSMISKQSALSPQRSLKFCQ